MPVRCWHAVRVPTRQRIGRTQYERSDRERSTSTTHRGTLSGHKGISWFPVLGEWHGLADSVVPARCSQNRRCRIACRRGAYRSPTKAGLAAGCRAGRRPCGDRTYHPNTEYSRSRDRRRSIPSGRRVGIRLSIVRVAAKPSEMIPWLTTERKLSIR